MEELRKTGSRSDKSKTHSQVVKVPPNETEIERVVLGALMLDKNAQVVAIGRLFPEVFYLEAHKAVYAAIRSIYDRSGQIDVITVVDHLRRDGKLEMVGGAFEVTKLTNSVTSGAHIENHILILYEMFLKRETIRIGGESISKAYSEEGDAFEIIANLSEGVEKAQESVLGGQQKDISYYGAKVIDQHKAVQETGVLGIKTGIEAIDQTICGLVAPDLLIIAARPGQGKTALALSITHNTSVQRNIPCAWFSLEMDGVQLVRRLASIECGIDHERIRNGRTSPEEDQKLFNAIGKISKCKIHIEDKTNINSRYIRTRLSLLKKKHNVGFAVVDYIQLMEGIDQRGKSREQIVSEISRSLKCTAKELEMPIIALSQLSRAVEARTDKMPQLADLRESGAIEQDADEVLFLMRPEYYGMTEPVSISENEYMVSGLAIGSVAKNRHGATKNIALKFTGSTMRFTDNKIEVHQPNGSWRPVTID
jgi:replicative DNA helicase